MTRFERREEYKDRLRQLLGVEELPQPYNNLFDIETFARLDVILDLAETLATNVSSNIIEINGDGPQKLQAIYEAAQKAKGKLAETILAIIESNDFEDTPNDGQQDANSPKS